MDTSFEQQVRERAYAIWMAEGQTDGMAHEHWVTAEQALAGEVASVKKTATKKAAAKPVVAKKASTKKAAPKANAKTVVAKTVVAKAAKAKPASELRH